MSDTITGYVNPDGSSKGNWVAADTRTISLLDYLLHMRGPVNTALIRDRFILPLLAAERHATDLWWAQRYLAGYKSDGSGLAACKELMDRTTAILNAEAQR